MSEQYYQKEDTPPDTLETMTDMFQQAAAPLATAADDTQQLLNNVEQTLGSLYQSAEASGDEDTKQKTLTVWNHTQQMATQVQHYDAAIQAAKAVIEKSNEQRQSVVDELESLTRAIEDVDTYDPRLSDFAESVVEDAEMYWEDSQGDYFADIAYDSLYEDLVEHLGNQIGMKCQETNRFVAALMQQKSLSELQREMLKALILTFTPSVVPVNLDDTPEADEDD